MATRLSTITRHHEDASHHPCQRACVTVRFSLYFSHDDSMPTMCLSTSQEDDGMPMRPSQDDDMHAIVKMRRVPSVLKGVRQCAC